MKFNFLIVLSLIIVSCKNEIKSDSTKKIFCGDELEIFINDDRILINNDNESAIMEKAIPKSKTSEFISFKLSNEERKLIFKNAFVVILNENYTINTLTCNAGQNFRLKLNCPNKSLEFHNSSIESWSKISKETIEIYSILSKKINIIK